MKKLISILLFSTICLGTKALGPTYPNIWTYGAHYMDVTMKDGKKHTFENDRIEFTACNHNRTGSIRISLVDDTPAGYEKLKKMMSDVQTKIKATPYSEEGKWDKDGIRHYSKKTGNAWNGYEGILCFQPDDIKEIALY